MKKGFTVIVVAAILAAAAMLAIGDENTEKIDTDTEWAIYWYLCGSDLETDYGSATDDLLEMLDVELPENVQVVIQTGGSDAWHNDIVNANQGQRFLYDSKGFRTIDEFEPVNMGDSLTLENFLSFCKENYPAKHTMVSFWNHGGGSVGGVAFDEQFEMDRLTLDEMHGVFNSVFKADDSNEPIDIVGFDACLMATVDTANIFSGFARYLVASEENEPANGWLYSGWLDTIAKNPQAEPLEVAKAICDTYVKGCEKEGTQDNITLSVTNLSYAPALMNAYDNFGKEALFAALENPAFFAHFSKIASSIENYGGNTREQGFTNMADLGHLAKQSEEYLPQSSIEVVGALENCIEYKVNGKYRPKSQGLSCYYSYSGDLDDLSEYSKLSEKEAFKYFFAYGLTGKLEEDGIKYLEKMNHSTVLPELKTLKSVDWEDLPLTVDESGCATLTLGAQANDILASIAFELYYADPQEDIMLCLGTDNDIIADWDKGVFKDNFRGVWGSIDGAICYMEIEYECESYNRYSIPILLNEEEYNLLVIYDFENEEFYIEGARKPVDEYGAADKNLRCLENGDIITTIHYGASLSEDIQELTAVPVDTVTVTEDTVFSETELGDGLFIMMYAMKDSQGNVVYSQAATFEALDGEIITTVD